MYISGTQCTLPANVVSYTTKWLYSFRNQVSHFGQQTCVRFMNQLSELQCTLHAIAALTCTLWQTDIAWPDAHQLVDSVVDKHNAHHTQPKQRCALTCKANQSRLCRLSLSFCFCQLGGRHEQEICCMSPTGQFTTDMCLSSHPGIYL